MKIISPEFTLNADLLRQVGTPKYLFLLHGFTGSSSDWKFISEGIDETFNVIGIDLIGHGKSDSPDEPSLYTASAIASQVQKVIRDFTEEKVVILGYSMGGRAAISFTVNFPHMLKGLILESSSPGLKSEPEKKERIKNDKEVIEFIKNHAVEEFIDYWMSLDIFNTQKRFSNEKLKEIKDSKAFINKTGLINSLRGFGTGIMPSYWNHLGEMNIRTLLITGELDEKFSLLNSEMAKILPLAEHVKIQTAGHNTHLEEPIKFIKAVNKFLKNM